MFRYSSHILIFLDVATQAVGGPNHFVWSFIQKYFKTTLFLHGGLAFIILHFIYFILFMPIGPRYLASIQPLAIKFSRK